MTMKTNIKEFELPGGPAMALVAGEQGGMFGMQVDAGVPMPGRVVRASAVVYGSSDKGQFDIRLTCVHTEARNSVLVGGLMEDANMVIPIPMVTPWPKGSRLLCSVASNVPRAVFRVDLTCVAVVEEADEPRVNKFWLRDLGGHPDTLVGWYELPDGKLVYSRATCNPKDRRNPKVGFDRNHAHNLVEHKILNRGEVRTIPPIVNTDPRVVIVADIADKGRRGTSYVAAAERWLLNRGIKRSNGERINLFDREP